MKKIKLITVGNESYQLTDPEAAHLADGTVAEDVAWSAKYLLDRLCPAFRKTGKLVACEPVAGYPLTVEVEDTATGITRYGKNLFDKNTEIAQRTYGEITRWGYSVRLPDGTYTVHLEHVDEANSNYVYIYHYDVSGSIKGNAQLSNGTKLNPWTFSYAEGDKLYIVNGKDQTEKYAVEMFKKYNMQIEVGSVATAFEPYQVNSFAPGEEILALPGVNAFMADAGNITVAGRLDPVTLLENLQTALTEGKEE